MAVPFYQFLHTLILSIAVFSFCQSEVFLALTHMTDFVYLEQTFGSYLEEYLHHNPSAPSDLKRLANDVEQHLKATEDDDIEVFLGHPVNSYLLVRRFIREWRNAVDKLDATNPIGQGKHVSFLHKQKKKIYFSCGKNFKEISRG